MILNSSFGLYIIISFFYLVVPILEIVKNIPENYII